MKQHVHILGSKWTIHHLKQSEDTMLEKCDGYCDWTTRRIVIKKCEPNEMSVSDLEAIEKATLRHEIVHAFLAESGLHSNCGCYSGAWAQNEEMVDWVALQGPKIYAAWQEAGAL